MRSLTPRPTVPLPPESRPATPVAPALPPRSSLDRVPGVRALRIFRAHVRARLEAARALERGTPEEFGFSVDTATHLYTITGCMYRLYFRATCHGIEHLPAGPCMLIANHGSHVLAWDGANILSACLLDATPPRLVHGMAEHRLMTLPVLGAAARRIGAVDGNRAACAQLLRSGAAVLAFPEGVKALRRPFRERYQLRPFGHGFMHVALATGVPIVPVAVIGAEEEAPVVADPGWLRRLVRTPVAPLAPTLFVPLPVRYRLHFGAPMRFGGAASPHRVARQVEDVRKTLQELIQSGLAARSHVFR